MSRSAGGGTRHTSTQPWPRVRSDGWASLTLHRPPTCGSPCGDLPVETGPLSGGVRVTFDLQADACGLSREFEAKRGVGSLKPPLPSTQSACGPDPTARATRARPAIAARRADRYGFPAPLPRCHRATSAARGRQRSGGPAYRGRVRAPPDRSARPRPAGRVRPQARVRSRPARRATAAVSTPWYGAPGRTA